MCRSQQPKSREHYASAILFRRSSVIFGSAWADLIRVKGPSVWRVWAPAKAVALKELEQQWRCTVNLEDV
jgi:hypothetical protein